MCHYFLPIPIKLQSTPTPLVLNLIYLTFGNIDDFLKSQPCYTYFFICHAMRGNQGLVNLCTFGVIGVVMKYLLYLAYSRKNNSFTRGGREKLSGSQICHRHSIPNSTLSTVAARRDKIEKEKERE